MRMVNGGLRRAAGMMVRGTYLANSVGQARSKALIASAMQAGSPERKQPDRQASIESALRTVATEQAGVAALADALENGLAEPFARAVDLISRSEGRVIVTGVGKSGHIGS